MLQANTTKRTAGSSNVFKRGIEIPAAPKPQSKTVSLEKIQEKAYELFLKRNGGPGSAEEDWLKAEKILKSY